MIFYEESWLQSIRKKKILLELNEVQKCCTHVKHRGNTALYCWKWAHTPMWHIFSVLCTVVRFSVMIHLSFVAGQIWRALMYEIKSQDYFWEKKKTEENCVTLDSSIKFRTSSLKHKRDWDSFSSLLFKNYLLVYQNNWKHVLLLRGGLLIEFPSQGLNSPTSLVTGVANHKPHL